MLEAILSEFKTYYKARAIKTPRNWPKDRQSFNRTEERVQKQNHTYTDN